MKKFVVVDGNSILNRAFYGIMSSKMLQTADGTYTNAVYGFLAILFKLIEDVNPDYLAVAFDVKHPTKRHELYKDYKGTRKGMPDELAVQLPIIKNVLTAMNIKILEKPGYEADDILGTLAKTFEKEMQVILLTGDRDSFQLASKNTIIRIPRTRAGKTDVEDYDDKKIMEEYGLKPKDLIEVKGLMGDTSDNIPGVPGVGEKTALSLIQEYKSIDNIYKLLDAGEEVAKGKLKEKLIANKDLAYLSRQLGTIDCDAPIDKNLDDFKVVEWNYADVLELFKELRFNRYIERFNLQEKALNSGAEVRVSTKDISTLFEYEEVTDQEKIQQLIKKFESSKELVFAFEKDDINNDLLIIKKKIKYINIYDEEDNKVYNFKFSKDFLKLFENENIKKVGYRLKEDYIILKELGIKPNNMMYDAKIAAYLLNSVTNAYSLEDISRVYLDAEIDMLTQEKKENVQTSLFDESADMQNIEKPQFKYAIYTYVIAATKPVLEQKLKEIGSLELFETIEMPLVEILAEMQFYGIYADIKEIVKYGEHLKKHIEELRIDIYKLAGEEFNINSPKQLGVILFEKLKLEPAKKNKNGYSTDVETLEKIRDKHFIVEKILEYRQLAKLNSTYVEGMIPYINEKTGRIHTYFHQTITATGRLSSTEPNLQNIPTRTEIGKKLRKVFKAGQDKVFVDADYSQIELRVLAHMANDEAMIEAFNSGEDIHTITASQVFKVPVEDVSKQLRSKAKAVNFGIVYGISEFGLAEQIDINRKEAKQYIEQYLETYHGIKTYMSKVVEEAKERGYIDTLFNRRRYIPELGSKNYMIRKFGERAAMNTPIQGTAADIMKIAMIKVYNELNRRNLKSKIVLQIHDELLIEAVDSEKEEVKQLLKECMEEATTLKVPLTVEVEEGKNWFQAK